MFRLEVIWKSLLLMNTCSPRISHRDWDSKLYIRICKTIVSTLQNLKSSKQQKRWRKRNIINRLIFYICLNTSNHVCPSYSSNDSCVSNYCYSFSDMKDTKKEPAHLKKWFNTRIALWVKFGVHPGRRSNEDVFNRNWRAREIKLTWHKESLCKQYLIMRATGKN